MPYRSLGGIALLCALGQAPAVAATISVGGSCTLVDAITVAHYNTDTVTGGCSAGKGLLAIREIAATATNTPVTISNTPVTLRLKRR